MVGLRNGYIRKNLIQNGEPQRYSWGTQKKKKMARVGEIIFHQYFRSIFKGWQLVTKGSSKVLKTHLTSFWKVGLFMYTRVTGQWLLFLFRHKINCVGGWNSHKINCAGGWDSNKINCAGAWDSHKINCAGGWDSHKINYAGEWDSHKINCAGGWDSHVVACAGVWQPQDDLHWCIWWKDMWNVHLWAVKQTLNKL